MGILIIGGCLVIAAAALIALFFIIRSSNTSKPHPIKPAPRTAREELPTALQPETTQPEPLHASVPAETVTAHNELPVDASSDTSTNAPEEASNLDQPVTKSASAGQQPVQPVQTVQSETQPGEPLTATAASSNDHNGTALVHAADSQERPLRVHLNGQFHELTSGLRDLQNQATEMEQRLNALTHMLESIEPEK